MPPVLLTIVIFLTPHLCLAQQPIFVYPVQDGSTTVSLDEGSRVGTAVLTVLLDQPTSEVTAITAVRVSDGVDVSGHLVLVASSEQIITKVVLDFETTSVYMVTVTAVSDTTETETATFRLQVTDLKDETPEFDASNKYTVPWAEEQPSGSTVFPSFVVNDKDAGDTHTFTLTGLHANQFYVNPSTGEIKALRQLDRDATGATTFFTMDLTVTDQGSNSATETLEVTLTDINDNPPVCTPALYSSTVPENSNMDTNVATLTCTDIDDGNNGVINRSTIVSGDDQAEKFKNSGADVLTRNNQLDYEAKDSYTLVVHVIDDGPTPMTGSATVVVFVGNVNEHTPSFAPVTYTAAVDEDAGAGILVTKVTATDQDTGGKDGTIRYSIVSGNGVSAFTIDSATGQISTTGVGLDREVTDTHTLTVRASDDVPGSPTEKFADATVVITVIDVNDNAPLCTPVVYQARVTEPSGMAATVVTLTAVDDDEAGTAFATTTFTITGGNSPVFFQISGSDVQLTQPVDYETTKSYTLTIRVEDQGTPPLSSTCRVDVTIVSANEFPPITTDPNQSINLPEITAIGTVVHDVDATDEDQGIGSVITYNITSGNTNSDFFCYASTGEVVVWNALDFDTPPQTYNLTIEAADDGGLSGSMWLFVQLTDSNDQVPQFTNNVYAVTVQENVANFTKVATVQAVDTDTGPAGTVVYTAVSGNGMALFAVDSDTGDVTTTGNIDREVRNRYSLVIQASDGGTPSLSSTALVDITIEDLNDNAPKFTPEDFIVNVREDVGVGVSVTTVTAADADSAASNNVFSYVLADTHFEVDAATGVVTVKATLDRETKSEHVLKIEAPDSGAPSLTGTATVTVIVDDVNDNTPVITGIYTPTVPENTATGTIVTTVIATDKDSGDNARLTYVIVNGNTDNDFIISDVNGIIQVKNSLNRERTASYNLIVEVNDNGNPKLTATITATIIITDINDNAPKWLSNSYSFAVSENVAAGQAVGTVAATDADIGVNAALTFSVVLFWTGERAHFNLDGATGAITTATPLDRETTAQYQAWLRVTDAGTPQLHADVNVSIAVTDLNDNEPRFDSVSYDVTTIENKPVGTGLLIVTVTDDDIGVNADVTLSIDTSTVAGARAAQFFEVTSGTGVVAVKQVLDRETDASFFFTLLAKDGGTPSHTSSANVTVTVADVNDNAPVFTQSYYNTEIAYSGQCTRSIVTLTATDADTGLNGQVTYFLQTTSFANLFQVDASSGEFSMLSGLTAKTMYTMNVSARDGGTPTLTANTPTLIRVDALVPNDVIVTFKLGITVPAFLKQQAAFLQLLQVMMQQTYPTAVAKLWCAETNSDGLADAHVYFLSDDSTESVASSNGAKYYVTQATARAVFTSDPAGSPNSALTGTEWAPYNIQSVLPYAESQTPWEETGEGIAIITVSAIAGLALLVAAAYMSVRYCRLFERSPFKQAKQPRQILVEERKPPARNNIQPEPTKQGHKPRAMIFEKDNLFWGHSGQLN
ncbi:hypothetical protein V1264_020097 [Littorina saxatilis]